MSTFLKTHERLLLIIAGLIVLLYLGHLYINRSADTADTKAKTAQVVAQQQATVDSQLADQVKQVTQQYSVLVTQLSAQNQQLSQSIAQRAQTVVVQQAKDATLSPADTAAKLAVQTGTKPTDVTARGDDVTLDSAASHAAVQKMDELAVAHQDLADYETLLDNSKTQIAALTTITTTQSDQIAGLQAEIKDDQKACSAQIADVRAQALKSKWHYFLTGIGIGAGGVLGAAAHIF